MRWTFSSLLFGATLLAAPAVANESDQIRQGASLFEEFCTLCHGANGQGGQGYPNPIWGPRAQIRKFKTAQGLYEYHQLLMPFNDPTLLTEEQKWAVTAFVLLHHGVLKSGDTLDPGAAAGVAIP